MGLHRVRTRLRKELAEHEQGARDGHEPTAEAHRVFGAHVADDLAAVDAAIDGETAIEVVLRAEIERLRAKTAEDSREIDEGERRRCELAELLRLERAAHERTKAEKVELTAERNRIADARDCESKNRFLDGDRLRRGIAAREAEVHALARALEEVRTELERVRAHVRATPGCVL